MILEYIIIVLTFVLLFIFFFFQLHEFEQAVFERDGIIQHLTSSLEQTISARDSFKAQLVARNTIPAPAVKLEGPADIQKRISDLDQALLNHIEAIKQLNGELDRSHEYIKALEADKSTQATEIHDYKVRINQLNEQIRTGAAENTISLSEAAEMQQQCEIQVEKIKKSMEVLIANFAAETNSKAVEHEKKIKEIDAKYQAEIASIKQNHDEQYKVLFERYNTELPALETKHAKELHVFQSQLSNYKKNIETLKTELENSTKTDQQPLSDVNILKMQLYACTQDKDMLQGQIEMQKQQIDDITAKCVAVSSVLNSKESIEKSLEEALINLDSLKRENEDLKFQYDDLSARYAAAQALIENAQSQERRMGHRILDLEKSLSRMSGINMSMGSEFNTTSYQTFNEDAVQFQVARQQLDEKECLEKKLMSKITDLEESVKTAQRQLEEANMEKRTFEKQLKDTKNRYDKIMSEVKLTPQSPQPFSSSLYFSDSPKLDASGKSSNESSSTLQPNTSNDVIEKIELYVKEIEELKETIQRRDTENNEINNKLSEAMERMKQFKAERDQLKKGLSNAWEECTELQLRLNQTLAMNESKFSELSVSNITHTNNDVGDVSAMNNTMNNGVSSLTQSESMTARLTNLSDIRKKLESVCLRTENIEEENKKLREENADLLKMQENFEALKKSLDELNAEKALFVKEIASLTSKHREQLKTFNSVSNNSQSVSPNDDQLALEKLKTEHAKEMEELRTYFEEKCLQMEKQYSEEIFSQQSKKVSEDSEIEELTDDLYFGGAGDCANVSKGISDANKGDEAIKRPVNQVIKFFYF